jgi:hypothetical protein
VAEAPLAPCRAVHPAFSAHRQRSPTGSAGFLTPSRGWVLLVCFPLAARLRGVLMPGGRCFPPEDHPTYLSVGSFSLSPFP